MARIIGMYSTAISCELKRNRCSNGYYPRAAHQYSLERRTDRHRPLKWTGRSRRLVEGKLRHQWRPEQISGWLGRIEPFSVSPEQIYQQIFMDRNRGGYSIPTFVSKKTKRISSKLAYEGSIPHRVIY